MVKVSDSPNPGFCDMNGRGVEVGCKVDQMPVTNPFDRADCLCFQKNFKFVEPGGQSLDGAE